MANLAPRNAVSTLRPHLSREILDGQFFALIVRLVGNAMVQLIRDEQVVWFVGNDAAMSLRVTERDWVILPDS